MQCKICGAEGGLWRNRSMQTLCGPCHRKTPHKVTKSVFRQRYFGVENVPAQTINEFYEDYLTSLYSLEDYIRETQEVIE